MGHIRAQCGITDKNISGCFAKHVGRTPWAYVIFHRLEVAKSLLMNETLAVTQIAFAIGYASESAFATAFRRKIDCTPTAYRKKEGQKNVRKRLRKYVR